MSQREDIIRVAAAEIGYKEGKNNATKYGKWYGMDNNPWCAMFVSWCANKANIPCSVVPKLAYVPYIYTFFNELGRFCSRGNYTPKPGDIVLFGSNDHVGLVEKVSGSTVYTIEGNTSSGGNNSNGDGVYRRTRALTNSWIKGYCIPMYDGEIFFDGGEDKVTVQVRALKNGNTGENVKALQILLNGHGYNCGTVDGAFGAKTTAAVKRFQAAKKLSADGICGVKTWAALLK